MAATSEWPERKQLETTVETSVHVPPVTNGGRSNDPMLMNQTIFPMSRDQLLHSNTGEQFLIIVTISAFRWRGLDTRNHKTRARLFFLMAVLTAGLESHSQHFLLRQFRFHTIPCFVPNICRTQLPVYCLADLSFSYWEIFILTQPSPRDSDRLHVVSSHATTPVCKVFCVLLSCVHSYKTQRTQILFTPHTKYENAGG